MSRGRIDYKWIALSNTTLGMLMTTLNSSILLIALPDIFRGVRLDPLQAGNSSYLLWLIVGYPIVLAVLTVSLGRVGDMFGRVRMFTLGFAIFTLFSVLLSVNPLTGPTGALMLIVLRLAQAVGGAFIFANSSAILTDAFPRGQRGLALGINSVAAIAGSFIGLVLGGVLAPVSWRLVFLVSVPFGVLATFWSYRSLREVPLGRETRIDWWGNVTFAGGLVALMVAITYGIQPYGGHAMGWTSPFVDACLTAGVLLLAAFCAVEQRAESPMFDLGLFRIRAFAAGNLAVFLSSIGRGGLQFVLIVWLQGIYLPQNGYAFSQTPLWAGIYMLPEIAGILIAGPISGHLSDRYGARPFTTGGMVVGTLTFALLIVVPVNFNYAWFAWILFLNGIAWGLFSSPNSAAVMNSLPPNRRGVGAGMLATAMNSAAVLSIGIFFTLMVVGLSSRLPQALEHGPVRHGVAAQPAARISHLPPVTTLFAAFLGYNPMKTLLGPGELRSLPPAQSRQLTGRAFFPRLISTPFHDALDVAFAFSICACLIAAGASLLRGGKYHFEEAVAAEPALEAV